MFEDFKNKLIEEGRSINTVNSYLLHLNKYKKWYFDSFSMEFLHLYRENILDFKSYIINVENLKSKSINAILSSLLKYNKFLVEVGIQRDIVIKKTDKIKIQENFASLSTVTKEEVEEFRQKILQNEMKRDYCLITLLCYTGIRISEAINIKMEDFNLQTRELIVIGKGGKQRIVLLNDKSINCLREYLRAHNNSPYLFYSRQSEKLNRTTVNKLFNKYSNKITPHTLRHFFCSRAVEIMPISMVSNLAGHSNVNTTLLYTNPSLREMKEKVNML